MPNQPKTPHRTIRIPTDLWQRALSRARRDGTTLTAVIVEFLERYTAEDRKGRHGT